MAETKTTTRPDLYLAGPADGMVTLEDLTLLYKQLTGKDPTPEDLAEARAMLERRADGA